MTKQVSKTRLAAAFLSGCLLLSPTAFAQEAMPPDGMPFRYALGFELFQDNCAQCHGTDLDGADQGPPLLHAYYKPSHHGDVAFYRAIQYGSPQHHWNFGYMKPVEGVDENQALAIVELVRWYQREAGLY